MQRLRRSGRGHLYFELVEKGRGDDIVAKLETVIWRSDLEQVERLLADHDQRLTEGVEIRCRGEADFYPPFGRLQFVARRLDPEFTAGLLSRRRRQTLTALEATGLLEKNKALEMPPVPLDVALVTSSDSAAYHDFLSGLARSGYGFRVSFVHSAVQGKEAENELVAAFARAEASRADCLVVVRGGGSRTDLAVFDSRRVAEALARSSLPVVTGLGHQIDEAVSDLVAHTRTKTPSQAAEFLVERVRAADATMAELGEGLARLAARALEASTTRLSGIRRGLGAARYRVAAAGAAVGTLIVRVRGGAVARTRAAESRSAASGARLLASSSIRLREERRRAARFDQTLARQARRRIERQRKQLAGLERLSRQLSPARTLRRGFSITRTPDGRAVRSSAAVAQGTVLETQLAEGSIVSRVEVP